MPTIKEIKDKVDLVRKGIEPETARIILQFEQQILDLIRESQLYNKGIDGNGKELKEYVRITKILKSNKNQRIENTTLKDTGAFYRSFQTDYGSFQLEVFATDQKIGKLQKKYGEDIVSFTVASEQELSDKIIRPNLIKYFKKYY